MSFILLATNPNECSVYIAWWLGDPFHLRRRFKVLKIMSFIDKDVINAQFIENEHGFKGSYLSAALHTSLNL